MDWAVTAIAGAAGVLVIVATAPAVAGDMLVCPIRNGFDYLSTFRNASVASGREARLERGAVMRHRRVVVTGHGGPELLDVIEEESPEPGEGEVRVRGLPSLLA